ncbi:unnamed protein product [Camellia sinensis]
MDAVESGIKPCDLAKETLHPHPLIPFTLSKAIIVGYLGIFSIYWAFCFLRFFLCTAEGHFKNPSILLQQSMRNG